MGSTGLRSGRSCGRLGSCWPCRKSQIGLEKQIIFGGIFNVQDSLKGFNMKEPALSSPSNFNLLEKSASLL